LYQTTSDAEQCLTRWQFCNVKMLVVQGWKKQHHQTTSAAARRHCYQKPGADWPPMLLHAAYAPADTALISGAPRTDGILALAKHSTVYTIDEFHTKITLTTVAGDIYILTLESNNQKLQNTLSTLHRH